MALILRFLSLIICFFFPFVAVCTLDKSAQQLAQKTISGSQKSSMELNEKLLPESLIEALSGASSMPNPTEQSVDQTHTGFIQESFAGRPQFSSDSINHLINKRQSGYEEDGNCISYAPACEQQLIKQECYEPRESQRVSCSSELKIKVSPAKRINEQLNVAFGIYNKRQNTLAIDLTKAALARPVEGHYADSVVVDIHVSHDLKHTYCPDLKLKYLSHRLENMGNVPGTYVTKNVRAGVSQHPSCDNGLIGVYGIKKHKEPEWNKRGAVFTYRLDYNRPARVESEVWQDSCKSLHESIYLGQCKQIDEICVSGPEKQTIDNLVIERDCWRKQKIYLCQYAQNENQCRALQKRGCEQIGSECIEYSNNSVCTVYKQTYHCAKVSCSERTQKICDVKPRCIDGLCGSNQHKPNEDFASAISQLAGLQAVGQSFDEDNLSIFSGEKNRCRSDFAKYKNCCKDKGWGLDANITHCTEEEETLFKDKTNGFCHYVGEYCSKKLFERCLVKKKSYCCFANKLGRLIQEEARTQLSLDWGTGKEPICRGLTAAELQRVDFSKVDMSEISSAMMAQVQQPELVQSIEKMGQGLNKLFKLNKRTGVSAY